MNPKCWTSEHNVIPTMFLLYLTYYHGQNNIHILKHISFLTEKAELSLLFL